MAGRRSSRRMMYFYAVLVFTLFVGVFVRSPLLPKYGEGRSAFLQNTVGTTFRHRKPDTPYQPPSLQTTRAKYAFATFLTDDSEDKETKDPNKDRFFVGTRILAYQLLHAPETRSQPEVPLVVLVSQNVSNYKRERLQKDGAIIFETPLIESTWIKTDVAAWRQVMAKLYLLKLIQFDRVAFLDSDTVLVSSIAGVFDDPAVAELQQTGNDSKAVRPDESALPHSYSFAAMLEMNREHSYPPKEEHHDFPNRNYFNAGFFVVKPSLVLLDYYLSLTKLENRFDPAMPEQNLLNYAHRPEGNMPWKLVDFKWNIHLPNSADLNGGVKSMHEKWWMPVAEDLTPFLLSWRWRMEGFFEARDSMTA